MKKIIILSIILFLSTAWTVCADDNGLLEILSIPSQNSEPALAGVGEYNGKGIIDKIYTDRVVINDSNFYFDKGVKVVNKDGKVHSGPLKENNYIYYFLNKDNRISKIVIESQ